MGVSPKVWMMVVMLCVDGMDGDSHRAEALC